MKLFRLVKVILALVSNGYAAASPPMIRRHLSCIDYLIEG